MTQARANGHFMGTTRMGLDPATSVCDRWGFTHQIRNLGIIDGSVFPTAGGMNPTSTICALALRTAQRLIEQRGPSPSETAHPARAAERPSERVPATLRVSNRSSGFTAPERQVLRRVAEVLIPEGDGMPSAAAAGVADDLLDALMRARPDLADLLRSALQDVPAGELTVERLECCPRKSLATLRLVVSGAYYLSPVVRDLLQWHNERGRPLEIGAFPAYIEEGFLDHVLDAASAGA